MERWEILMPQVRVYCLYRVLELPIALDTVFD
jgi:hypothetical protein